MGEILGYPCHREYMYDMFKHKTIRVVTIMVDYAWNGISHQAQLIANICESDNMHLDKFKALAEEIEITLRTPENTRILSQYSGGDFLLTSVSIYPGPAPTWGDRMNVHWSNLWNPPPNQPAEDENLIGDYGCKLCRTKMPGMSKGEIREPE